MHNRTQVPKPRIPAIVPCSSSTYNWDLASTREHGLTHLHQKQQMYRQTSCSVVWLWPSGLSRPQGWLRLTEPKFKVEGSGMVWSGGRGWKTVEDGGRDDNTLSLQRTLTPWEMTWFCIWRIFKVSGLRKGHQTTIWQLSYLFMGRVYSFTARQGWICLWHPNKI